MAGQSGNVRRTIPGLRLINVDVDKDLLVIRGSIPGPNGSLVLVRQSRKAKGSS